MRFCRTSRDLRVHGGGRKPRARPSSPLQVLAGLTKLRISLLSTLSAATGYVVFCRAPDSGILSASSGVLLLAMGACAMNQYQDREIDARMERTRRRPISSGAIRPEHAAALALLLIACGFTLLWTVHNPTAALIGLLTVVWYNGLYACLKRASAFAAVPGALTGALPPVIGWTAAGGSPWDPHVLALSFFFFTWQVPHFWLLLSGRGAEFEEAGLPSLTKLFSQRQLAGLIFIWILSAAVSSLLLPIYLLTSSPWVNLGLVLCGLWISLAGARLLRHYLQRGIFAPTFRAVNVYALLVMALVATDALL